MGVAARCYDQATDFDRVSRFLVEVYEPGETFSNWLQPRWEYMHFHPQIWDVDLSAIGVFEDHGEIVGVVNLEHSPAFVYVQVRPGYEGIKPAMIDWAEAHLGGFSKSLGRYVLGVYVNDFDANLAAELAGRGFRRLDDHAEDHARFVVDGPVPPVELPKGFRLQSLAVENDLAKINGVLWRGFNHEGLPPDAEIPGRAFAQSAPNFRKDLTIVAVAPNGDYAAFGGMWFVAENGVAYVEPVATDPAYRRKGLGSAVVLESMRRVADLGAEIIWVGSGQEFYKALGFSVMFRGNLWIMDR